MAHKVRMLKDAKIGPPTTVEHLRGLQARFVHLPGEMQRHDQVPTADFPDSVGPHRLLLDALVMMDITDDMTGAHLQAVMWKRGLTNILAANQIRHAFFRALTSLLHHHRTRNLVEPTPHTLVSPEMVRFTTISNQDIMRGSTGALVPRHNDDQLYQLDWETNVKALFRSSELCVYLVADLLTQFYLRPFSIDQDVVRRVSDFVSVLALIRLHLPPQLLQDGKFIFCFFSMGEGAFYDLTYNPPSEVVQLRLKCPKLNCFTCNKAPRQMSGPRPSGHKLLRCTGCNLVFFCSVECQRVAHKVTRTHRCTKA